MQVHQQTPGQNTLKKRKNKGRKRTEEASPLRDHRAQKVMWLSGERRLLTRSSVLVGPTQWKERMRSCKLSWLSHACHSICAACTARTRTRAHMCSFCLLHCLPQSSLISQYLIQMSLTCLWVSQHGGAVWAHFTGMDHRSTEPVFASLSIWETLSFENGSNCMVNIIFHMIENIAYKLVLAIGKASRVT